MVSRMHASVQGRLFTTAKRWALLRLGDTGRRLQGGTLLTNLFFFYFIASFYTIFILAHVRWPKHLWHQI
jgi:hypothetical protein